MTEQSQPSSTASPKATRESSRVAAGALGPLNAKRHAREREDAPQRIGESMRNLPAMSGISSSTPIERTAAGLYLNAELPARHRRRLPDGKSPDEWNTACTRLFDAIGSGFLFALIGPRGTGKTQLGERTALQSTATSRAPLYTRAMTIFLELRATYRTDGAAESAVVKRFCEPKLLIIDEIQERAESAWEDRMLTHIIDVRYGAMGDTLLIGNLSPEQLAESLGPSIVDRLRETGGIIECKWDSFRKANPRPGLKE